MPTLAQQVKHHAAELGFDDCRIAAATEAPHAAEFHQWLAEGKHGDMAWLARDPARRSDPRIVLPGCRSVITLAMNYFPGDTPPENPEPGYRIARYAWNDDYHDLIEKRLKDFDTRLITLGGTQKRYVDTGPVLERDFASAAGLGWNGKSTMQIHRRLGTWFFLAELLTTLELPADAPFGDHCGKCVRCIDACPTRAITAPRRLDARRCISYLTIEHKGPIPEEFRTSMGNRIYGCDDCLAVCPWNKFARAASEAAFHARAELKLPGLDELAALDDAAFREVFSGSPIKRIGRDRFVRNVCIAIGNSGAARFVPQLEGLVTDASALVRGAAAWALLQLDAERFSFARSQNVAGETDPDVLREWNRST